MTAHKPASETRIAFIGLGHMGGPMAGNLVAAGYTVLGHDSALAAVDAARQRGVITVASVAEAVSGADVILT